VESAIEHLLDFTDLLLDLAFGFVSAAFSLKTLIADDLASGLFNAALHFLGVSFDLIMSTVFHGGMGLWVLIMASPPLSLRRELAVLFGGILNALPGLLDVLTGTIHGVAGGEREHAEQKRD
jgi:hypothetical protein